MQNKVNKIWSGITWAWLTIQNGLDVSLLGENKPQYRAEFGATAQPFMCSANKQHTASAAVERSRENCTFPPQTTGGRDASLLIQDMNIKREHEGGGVLWLHQSLARLLCER